MTLKIAAKVDRADAEYFEAVIRPLLNDPSIEYVGEIGDADKGAFLGGAAALLFPIDWPEPFGLVMIEAMAAGTPVIAWRCGSTAEVIEHGRSGFLVKDVEEALAAVEAVGGVSRTGVRAAFEARFTADRMARDYVALYERLIGADKPAMFGKTLTMAG
jgi:glycosyltransferase involved in cell wall biosynthesis